jgi:RimJ/RimL family protein N-acetyltransferase
MTGATHIEPVQLDVGAWLLRPPQPQDAAEALTMLTDTDVRRWNPVPSVADAATAKEWLARGADWSEGDHASFSVVEAATGRFAGNVSLHRIDREQANASIGYRTAAWARGRGAATAAVTQVTIWSFTSLGIQRVELCHAVANPASCRVAVKAGYAMEGTLRAAWAHADGNRYDEHIHGRLASDPTP